MKYGLGLRPAHYHDVINTKPRVDWFECLTEDFIDLRGPDFLALEKICEVYPISLHGVALSIGSCDSLNKKYLSDLKKLIHRVNPILISDHFCWTGVDQINTHDLLPLPYTIETIDHVVSRIIEVQDFLGRQIMLENVSSYIDFSDSEIPEWEFISAIANRADCFILLDINNVYVNAVNHGFSADDYLRGVSIHRVKQFHLSGHKNCGTHIIDTHDDKIALAVWDLYAKAIVQFPDVPLIIERDANIPALQELMDELEFARKYRIALSSGDAHAIATECRDARENCEAIRPSVMILKKIQQDLQSSILNQDTTITKHILSSTTLTPKQRLHIYQNSYYARMIVAMKQDFPKLCEAIGDSAFESLVVDYINHYPSKNYNLRDIGKYLAEFILSKDLEFQYYAMLAAEEYNALFQV